MTRYTVHIYREMRLRFDDIEAGGPAEAAEKARDLHFDDAADWSDCEGESLAALVDVQGDEECLESRVIDFEPGRRLKAALKLERALHRLLDAAAALPVTALNGAFDDALREARAALAEGGAG